MVGPELIRHYFLMGVMFVLAVTILVSLIRAIIGPRFSDRIVGINMVNTQVIIFIGILAVYLGEGGLTDIAILYALLSFLAVAIFTKIDIGILQSRKEAGKGPAPRKRETGPHLTRAQRRRAQAAKAADGREEDEP